MTKWDNKTRADKVKPDSFVKAKKRGGHIAFYWEPSRDFREMGFGIRRLAAKSNEAAQAKREAAILNQELRAFLLGQSAPGAIIPGTVAWLIREYQQSSWYKDLKSKSQQGYDTDATKMESYFGDKPLIAFDKPKAHKIYELMRQKNKLAVANKFMRFAKVLFKYAEEFGHIAPGSNPFKGVRLKTVDADLAIWTEAEIDGLLKAVERPPVGLAVILALETGQRQGDILRLTWADCDGEYFHVRQQKTGQYVRIPLTNRLKTALNDHPDAKTPQQWRKGKLIIRAWDTDDRSFTQRRFQTLFEKAKIAVLRKELLLDDAGKPIGIEKTFHNLRNTAVTGLSEAGCTIPEIAAISGHKLQGVHNILEQYLSVTNPQAEAAIAKLEAHRVKGGVE